MARCPCCGAAADALASVTSQSDLRDDLSAPLPLMGGQATLVGDADTGFEAFGIPDAPSVADPAVDTLWVETNVLACCNAAYERARATGAAEVTLLDLLYAICSAPTLTAWLAAYDIDGDLLRIEIEAREGEDVSYAVSVDTPRTSSQMKSALSAARREAERRLAVNLTIGDVLTAIQETDLGTATHLLNAHVTRERQRRRGGARGWQADAQSDLGALDRPLVRGDWTSVTREASNDSAALHETPAGVDRLTETAKQDAHLAGTAHGWPSASSAAEAAHGGASPTAVGIDDDARGDLFDDEDGEEGETFTLDDEGAGGHASAARDRAATGGIDWQGQILERLEVQALQLERLREELRGLRNQSPAASEVVDEAAGVSMSARASTPADGARELARTIEGDGKRHAHKATPYRFLSRDRIRADMRRTSRHRRQLSLIREREAAAVRQAQLREQQAREHMARDQAVREQQSARDGAQRMRMSVPASATGGAGGRQAGGPPASRQMIKPGAGMATARTDERALRAIDDDEGDDLDARQRTKRFYLSLSDDIVDAPSIGPKTAERLREHGINTVRDLLAIKAHVLSAKMGVRHITAERIASWQHQARLVCTIPWLRGTHAQILVGSGYYAPHSIVTANRDALCTAILRFATTREGQSVLRSSPPPSLGKIMRWVEQAALAELDRAA